jgi:hypothetical protein
MPTAGSTVKGGFYLNRDAWDVIAVSGREGVLPGADGERFVQIPIWAVLGLGPLAGALFVAFLPLIGLALVLRHLGRACASGGRCLLPIVRRLRRSSAREGAVQAGEPPPPAAQPKAPEPREPEPRE